MCKCRARNILSKLHVNTRREAARLARQKGSLRGGAAAFYAIIQGMPLTHQEVEHIAKLARLELSPAQEELYRQQLSSILDYIAKLRQLDTREVPPTAGGGLTRMVLRADEPRPGLTPEELLRNAPQAEDHQFKIPPVFE